MSRKKRRFEQLEEAASRPKEKVSYRDPFQQKVGSKLEDFGRKVEGKGRNILYGVGALAILGILIGIFYVWNSRSNATAQTALGKAIETSQAKISTSPAPAGSTEKTFKTEKERADAAIAEFQTIVDKFGGAAGEKARYFIAVTRISIDRPAAIAELQGLAASSGAVGKLSKYALAQAQAGDGKFDEAAALYQELAGMSDPIIPKDRIEFELAGIYEKQGKKTEAVDIYFNIAKAASEAKDADGKPAPQSEAARSSKEKIQELDPERAKQIQDPEPTSPFGGNPFGN